LVRLSDLRAIKCHGAATVLPPSSMANHLLSRVITATACLRSRITDCGFSKYVPVSNRQWRTYVTSVARPHASMRFRGRSYMAFALAPEPPVADWLVQIDEWIRNSAGFFVGRPVVLDLAAVSLSSAGVAHLVSELEARDIRIMGIEGADPAALGPGLPPALRGGRTINASEAAGAPAPTAMEAKEENSLVLDLPVRSGQSVVFPLGDVTVLGSIASGAEVVAGGSVHVYGTLRGRAMAGCNGNRSARILCRKLEAELLAIDGYYRAADDISAALRGRPAQAWLANAAVSVAEIE
jgi:septum site-determining protein MinC